MGRYRFLENIAIADAAFQAEADSLEELLQVCAQATFEVMADTKTVEHKHRVDVEVTAGNPEELLFGWLAELIYLKDLKSMLFSKFDVHVHRKNGYGLEACVWGEPADQQKHKVRVDVKAVTYHLLEVKRTSGKWAARVILDT